MEIHKIICDVCGKELDIEKDKALGLFEYYQANEFLTMNDIFKKDQTQQEPTIQKTKYDLCRNCLEKVEHHILEIKKKA